MFGRPKSAASEQTLTSCRAGAPSWLTAGRVRETGRRDSPPSAPAIVRRVLSSVYSDHRGVADENVDLDRAALQLCDAAATATASATSKAHAGRPCFPLSALLSAASSLSRLRRSDDLRAGARRGRRAMAKAEPATAAGDERAHALRSKDAPVAKVCLVRHTGPPSPARRACRTARLPRGTAGRRQTCAARTAPAAKSAATLPGA